MIKQLIRSIFCVFISFLLAYCATVSSPQGGPKDTTAPKFISSTTQNLSTNFNASNIILTFDEYIKLNNPSQTISTSPPLGNNLGLVALKNKLFVTFKEPLEENITYHINFGNSIVDVNEGNEFKNFQFIFSTGDKIDSISVKGNVEIGEEFDNSKPTLVGLYRDLSDSAFYKAAPFYYTFLEDNNTFAFRNLKNDTYQMIVLSDNNGNKYYDLPTEAVGFLPNAITLDSNITDLSLPIFISEPDSNRIKSFSSSIENYQIEFELIKSLGINETYNVSVFNDTQTFEFINKLDVSRKIVTIYLDSEVDSLSNLSSVFKINGILIDSFQHGISLKNKPEQELSLNSSNFMLLDSIIINSNLPITKVNENILVIDALKQDTLQFNPLLSIDNQLFIKPDKRLKINHVYTLLIKDSTVLDYLGQFNRNYTNTLKFESEEDRGKLFLDFENIDSSIQYILKIEDEQKNIVNQKTISQKNKNWNLEGLEPGTYKIKIIEDRNLNGVWNSGSIKNKTYPEKQYYFSKDIVIRPNWELEETINFVIP